ncbi:MAG: 4-(cytidine 5'-diphospho)-2-C-methyl-D-erythritol kinase [Clostridia bacterium]|nr:4-(cytidine 5'-diphospho)-2-C-methyl-D-erythritol kinase [Clostridia bacterium]
MMRKIEELACGKVNLHLDIVGREENGYHLVNNVMQTISLCDRLILEKIDSDQIFAECNREGVPGDDRNLAVRAALLFRERVDGVGGLRIEIDKQIPMAAGMAGGSADAAAVLRGLNRMHGNPLSVEELCSLGTKLGADVPFCVVGGTSYANGRGDRLHPFPSMPYGYLVCACEGEGVSTPWAYSLLDQKYGNFSEKEAYTPCSMDALRDACLKGSLEDVASSMYNIFEEPVLSQRPVAAELLMLLKKSDSLGAMMSGSGPSVFGIFADRESAEKASELLCCRGYRAYLCTPVNPK